MGASMIGTAPSIPHETYWVPKSQALIHTYIYEYIICLIVVDDDVDDDYGDDAASADDDDRCRKPVETVTGPGSLCRAGMS